MAVTNGRSRVQRWPPSHEGELQGSLKASKYSWIQEIRDAAASCRQPASRPGPRSGAGDVAAMGSARLATCMLGDAPSDIGSGWKMLTPPRPPACRTTGRRCRTFARRHGDRRAVGNFVHRLMSVAGCGLFPTNSVEVGELSAPERRNFSEPPWTSIRIRVCPSAACRGEFGRCRRRDRAPRARGSPAPRRTGRA